MFLHIYKRLNSSFASPFTGQKGKPEFLKDDDEFDVNTEKGTKRPAPNKTQGYGLCLLINILLTDCFWPGLN